MNNIMKIRRTIAVIAAIACMSSAAVYASADAINAGAAEQSCSTINSDITPAGENRKEVSVISVDAVAAEDNKASVSAIDEQITTGGKVYEIFGVLEGMVSADAEEVILGDANCDGNVDVSDIAAICTHINGAKALSEAGKANADINGDGNVDVSDIAKLAAHIKGIKAI